jgi:molecular chaperone GrpE (heat shock protein)
MDPHEAESEARKNHLFPPDEEDQPHLGKSPISSQDPTKLATTERHRRSARHMNNDRLAVLQAEFESASKRFNEAREPAEKRALLQRMGEAMRQMDNVVREFQGRFDVLAGQVNSIFQCRQVPRANCFP